MSNVSHFKSLFDISNTFLHHFAITYWFAANLAISRVSRPRGCGSRTEGSKSLECINACARQKVIYQKRQWIESDNRFEKGQVCYPPPLRAGAVSENVIALIFVPRSIYRWKQIGCPIIPLFVIVYNDSRHVTDNNLDRKASRYNPCPLWNGRVVDSFPIRRLSSN